MHNIYIFDIDGTLTPARQKMTEEFSKFFEKWTDKNNYYLVTGSDLEKVEEQIPLLYLQRAQGIFTCCGNVFYQNKLWKKDDVQEIHTVTLYENKFLPPEGLVDFLNKKVKDSSYTIKTSNHIENRGSMINFSVVGRDCSLEQRKNYYEWDIKHGERKQIVEEISQKWSGLEASIGGQISIDIYEPGMDKSQVLYHIKKTYTGLVDRYTFIGDKTMKGGNDYPLANIMKVIPNGFCYQTEGPEQTQKILESLID